LVVLAMGSARGKSLCLRVESSERPAAHFEIFPKDKLAIRFSHSLYGSAVEEEFHISATGFRAGRLRYGEPRLAEFYGHESAREENGLWVVDRPSVDFDSLDVHVSSDAAIRVSFRDRVLSLGHSHADLRARLTVTVCPVKKDG
jgi:hypothetical protein